MAPNIFDKYRVYFKIFRFIGCFPLDNEFKRTRSNIIQTLIIFVYYILFLKCALFVYVVNREVFFKSTRVQPYLFFTIQIFRVLITCFYYIVAFVKSSELRIVFYKFMIMSQSLKISDVNANTIRKTIFNMLLLRLFLIIIDFTYLMIAERSFFAQKDAIIILIGSYVEALISLSVELQFVIFIYELGSYIEYLEKSIFSYGADNLSSKMYYIIISAYMKVLVVGKNVTDYFFIPIILMVVFSFIKITVNSFHLCRWGFYFMYSRPGLSNFSTLRCFMTNLTSFCQVYQLITCCVATKFKVTICFKKLF